MFWRLKSLLNSLYRSFHIHNHTLKYVLYAPIFIRAGRGAYRIHLVSRSILGFGLQKMYIIKRDGRREEMLLDKITSRIKKLCYGLAKEYVDPAAITLKVVPKQNAFSQRE
jgi:hypothetical protein